MHRKFRIILWFLVGLFVASVASIALFLTSVSPIRGEFKIETVTIAANSQTPVRMTWRNFNCESENGFDRCTVPLPTGDLVITASFEKPTADNWQTLGCQATHAGENVVCDGNPLGFSVGGVRFLGIALINSDLSLSRTQLQALRRENWFVVDVQYGSIIWLMVSAGLATIASILFGFLLREYPSRLVKGFTAMMVGLSSFYFFALLTFNLYWFVGLAALLFNPFDLQNPSLPEPIDRVAYLLMSLAGRLTTSRLGLIVYAIIGAIAAAATLAMFWRHERKMPLTFAILGGASMFLLFNAFAYSFLVTYGYVQADY